MDRIIRFRGKRTDTGEWEYGSLYTPSDGVYADICNKSGDHPVHPETVSQLVCISASGDEIYEGDYIRSHRIRMISYSSDGIKQHVDLFFIIQKIIPSSVL